ncbi:MAG: PACE efflux transporter [Rhodospirillales bacterium]
MRNTGDRIRHAACFEIFGLITVTPLAAWAFDKPLFDIGLVAFVSAGIAAVWNYIYNLLFDHAMLRLIGAVAKTVPVRVLHAVLFEGGLLIVLMPFIAWYLDVTLLYAFLVDISFAAFFLVYAFLYNWAYDIIFPIPQSAPAETSAMGQKQT